jgi:hypothetical protein
LLWSLQLVNQQNIAYTQLLPFNFTNNNDSKRQSYTYDNGQENNQVPSEQKPTPIVSPGGATPNDTQIKHAVNDVFNTHTTESFNTTDSVATKIYKQIKSALDIQMGTLTNMDVRLASDREKVYARLALNNEIKAQVENLIMKDLMIQNINSVAK